MRPTPEPSGEREPQAQEQSEEDKATADVQPTGLTPQQLASQQLASQQLMDQLGLVAAASLGEPEERTSNTSRSSHGRRKKRPKSVQQLERQLKAYRDQQRAQHHQPLTGAGAPAFGRRAEDEEHEYTSAETPKNAQTEQGAMPDWAGEPQELPDWAQGDLPPDIAALLEREVTDHSEESNRGRLNPQSRGRENKKRNKGKSEKKHSAKPSDEPVEELSEAEAEQLCRESALRLLSTRERSRYEIEEKLTARELPESAIATVLDRFEEVGLLDDAAFAYAWVESRNRSRGYAAARLAQELRRKGIADHHIDNALAQLDSDELAEQAEEMALRRLGQRDLPPNQFGPDRREREKVTRRIVGYLQRKGYAPGLCMAVTRSAMERHDAGERR